MKTKRPKKTYSLRMDPITWNGIVKMATENDLTISDQIGMILKWALKRWEMPQPASTNTVRRSETGRYRSQYTPKKQPTKEEPEPKQEEEKTYVFDTIKETIEYSEKNPGAAYLFPIPKSWIRELDENPSIDVSELQLKGIIELDF